MEEALKQRLVGASVLVVLAVIFLPLLFDGSGMAKPTAPLSLDLPEASAENTVTITLKPQVPAPVVSAPPVKPKPTPQKAIAISKPKPVVKAIAKPVPNNRPAPQKPSAAKGAQWIVQLGSFGQRSNAQALRDKLINLGYKSFVEASGQGSSQVYRVRVGPETSRERAEAMRIKLQTKEKRKGLVMAYP